MTDLNNISIILPSLDPDEKLPGVIEGLLEVGFQDILLINDGSKPENLHYFTEAAAAHPEVTLLHHAVNRGKGAALKTAINYYLVHRPEGKGVVTVDGDGQHHKLDVLACAKAMAEHDEVVLGVRDFDQPDVPFRSRFGNKTTCGIFKLFVGMTITDTQTGLRAIPRKDLPTMLAIEGDRFEYETNMLLKLKQKSIPFREVKIRTVYIEENKTSHFRVIRDSWRIYKLILAHFFRYTLVSISSAVIDEGCYIAFSGLLQGLLSGFPLTASATAAARLISSLFNFFMNKSVVFQSGVSTGLAMLRYYALALPMLAAQALLTHGTYALFSIPDSATGLRALIYAVVMTVLYLVSYMAQQRWVFKEKRDAK